MLLSTLLLAATQLVVHQGPASPPGDTTRLVQGFRNQAFAWGTVVMQNGRRLQGYLPATASGMELMVPYYAQAPDSQPAVKPKFLGVYKVKWMRVQGQYYELLNPDKLEMARLAARRQTGAVDLFLAQMTVPPLVTSFLGAAPVLSSPATNAAGTTMKSWYLRRSTGAPLLITPENFAKQVAAFLADDKELAAKVAAGAPDCQFDDLEALIRQYNQRARR
jgi:hypothetical protein